MWLTLLGMLLRSEHWGPQLIRWRTVYHLRWTLFISRFLKSFHGAKKRILGTKKKRTPSLLITIYCLVTVFSGQTWYTHLWIFFHKAIYLVCVNSSWIFEILPYLNLYVKVKTLGKAWKNIWRLWPLLSWKRVKSSCNSNFQFRIVSKNFKAFSSFDFKSIDSYNQDNKILYSVMKNN